MCCIVLFTQYIHTCIETLAISYALQIKLNGMDLATDGGCCKVSNAGKKKLVISFLLLRGSEKMHENA
jgi:hypothetical protein